MDGNNCEFPAGLADEEYTISRRILEGLQDWNGYYVDIKVCSMWNDLDFQDMQIYRVAQRRAENYA